MLRLLRRCRALLLAPALAAALAAALPHPAVAQRTPRDVPPSRAGRCIGGEPVVAPARLGPTHRVYVEQEVVSAQRDGRVLLAGKPTYLWRRDGQAFAAVGSDSLLGIVIDSGFGTRALASPLRGRPIASIRAAAMDDGWWLVTFAEVVPAKVPHDPLILAMWAGETDGARWRAVERLPAVPDSMEAWSVSALLWRDGRATLAVPSRLLGPRRSDNRIVFYERRAGRWTASSRDFGMRSYVAVGATPTHEVLAVVRPDTTALPDRNSLFLYVRRHADSAWTPRSRLARGGDERPARDPILLADGEGLLLSWRVSDVRRRTDEAWFARLGADGSPAFAPVRLGDEARLLYAATRDGRGAWAVMGPLPGAGSEMLKLFQYDGSARATTIAVSPSPYMGLLGLALTPSHLMLIGARMTRDERIDPPVSTILHAFPWRCATR